GRPPTGDVDLAGEAAGAFDIGRLRQRQATAGHHVVPASHLLTAVGREAPALLALVPSRGGDAGGELDVGAQAVAVGHEAEILEHLRLGGVLLRPGPVAFQLRVEAVRLVRGGDVAARAGIAVPVPGPADVTRRVEDPDGKP